MVVHSITVVGDDVKRTDLVAQAYSMAYITLFALIPALAAVFTLIGFFNPIVGEQGTLLVQVKSLILKNLAAGTGDQVINYLENFLGNLDMKKIGATQFATMILSLALLLRQVEMSLNRVFQVKQTRHMITRFVYFWTFLTLTSLVASIGFAILSDFKTSNLIPFLADPVKGQTSLFTDISTAMFPPLAVLAFFYLLYKVVPNCRIRPKFAFAGALMATFSLTIASQSFGWILKHFYKSFPAIYGALASVPAFLLWLFILWAITLFGAIVTWRLQQGIGQGEFLRVMEQYRPQVSLAGVQISLESRARDLLIPYLVLFVVEANFHKDEKRGISGSEIAGHLNLSLEIVTQALLYLLRHGLVVGAFKEGETDLGIVNSTPLFPTHPGDKITLADMHAMVFSDFKLWFENWKNELVDEDLKRLLTHLESQIKSLPSQKNLLSFVK